MYVLFNYTHIELLYSHLFSEHLKVSKCALTVSHAIKVCMTVCSFGKIELIDTTKKRSLHVTQILKRGRIL